MPGTEPRDDEPIPIPNIERIVAHTMKRGIKFDEAAAELGIPARVQDDVEKQRGERTSVERLVMCRFGGNNFLCSAAPGQVERLVIRDLCLTFTNAGVNELRHCVGASKSKTVLLHCAIPAFQSSLGIGL